MITYYKRVVNGKVKELHVHEQHKDYISCIIYPSPKNDEGYYNLKEFEEIELLDEWLDIGLEFGIFK